jgi:hypothetical protein
MRHTKRREKPVTAERASLNKEMAKPRVARSARIAQLTSRIPGPPSTVLPGTADIIIPSPRPRQPEKAQIAVNGPDRRYRDLRIENSLTDEHGDDVKLKKGAHVEVTVSSNPKK